MVKKHTHIIFVLLTLLVAGYSCKDDFTNTNTDTGKLVVDGYIENGGKARVILTFSLPITTEIDSSKYLEIVTTRATVKLFEGEKSELLTLRWDRNAFPQHFYESEKIRGEVGKTYRIEVYYEGDTLHATTSIPSPIQIDSIWTTTSKTDSLKSYLWAQFCDDSTELNYYRFFTRIIGKQDAYVPVYLSAIDDKLSNGMCNKISLYKGAENFFEKDREDVFDIGDTILVKATTIDKASYLFWKNYEREVFNLGNPFAGNGTNLNSNVEGNGLGIWCGYNVSIFQVIIR